MTTVPATLPAIDRARGLGASDVAAACGLDPYRSELDLWLEKTGQAEPFADNEHTRWGRRIEAVLRSALAETLEDREPAVVEDLASLFDGRILAVNVTQQQVTVRHRRHEWLWATPDDVYVARGGAGPRRPVAGGEVKNRSVRVAHRWGDPGTGVIPDDVAVQCHVGMACLELEEWVIGAYFGGADFRTYWLQRDLEIAAELIARAQAFWDTYVLGGQMPPVTRGDERVARTLARLFPLHTDLIGEATPAEAALIEELVGARAARELAEHAEELLKNQLRAAIGERAGLQGPTGRVTWKATRGGAVTQWDQVVEALRPAVDPDQLAAAIAAHTVQKAGYRRFLVSPAKELR